MRNAVVFWWSLVCACLLGWLPAQETAAEGDSEPLPPPPADLVLDESRVFARDPQGLDGVRQAVARLADEHGLRLYFVLYDSLYGRSLADRAQRLKDAWLGTEPGMVVVLETDSRTFRVGQNAAAFSPGNELPVPGPLEFTPLELSRIIDRMAAELQAAEDEAAFATILGTRLADECGAILKQREMRPEGRSRRHVILLAIGLGAAVGLLALLVAGYLSRAEARARQRFVFPDVHVAQRIGAPFGGGKVISRSFGSPARKE